MTMMMLSMMILNNSTMIVILLSPLIMWYLFQLMQPSLMMNYYYQDNISSLMMILNLMTIMLTIMASDNKKMITLIMMINLLLMATFNMSSLLMFYIFFELSIVPTFLLIMYFGNQPERMKASMYLLMYTIFASLPLFASILWLNPNSKMLPLMYTNIYISLPLLIILAFLVKLPMFSFHMWLPKAHVEAPMEGSMILAAILLKLGSYGLLRTLPLMKSFNKLQSPIFMSISMMGCIYTTLTCMRHKDMKAMIAYSSVAHMALIIISLFSLSSQSQQAAILMSISHGLISASLFMLVTMTYKNHHSRNLFMFKGMINSNTNMSFWWFMLLAANIGTPPFISLMSEIMSVSASMKWSLTLTMPFIMSMMLMAAFSINMYTMINHNTTNQNNQNTNTKTKKHITLFMFMMPNIMMVMNPLMLIYTQSL